ncbi:hypothetical protein B0H65DRAFT_569937 [Neurospora tetraspora]|uniref:Uncharacterized protein n=1 Tax=Neurospora tetraspora TaxID=94610 RepID=A0AAE0JML8_9PEZI|nr:hypothetical protein B0H65DRAFT_569937 [Neurospora tetraspora]
MPDKPSDQPSRRRSSRSRSPEHGPAQVRDRMEPRKRDNRGAQKGKQSLSKSAQQQVRHLLTVGQSTRGVGKSMSDLTNIKPKFDEQGKLFPLISDDEVLYRFNKKGGNEPDFMERVSADPSASDFNWMARQDRFSKPNAYIGKTTTDRQSLAALVNRIEQLAEEHNTSVASFRIELVPQFFVENIATKLKKASQVAEAPVVCGNKLCGRKGHTLAQCVIPDPKTGLVYGCPLCNTGDHLVDMDCPRKPQPAPGARHVDRVKIKGYVETLLDAIFVKRANRPSFATNGMTWPLFFHSYRKDAKAIKSYAELDGSVWDTKGRYPWTHKYAMKMVDTEEKLAQLWGFDPAKDDPFSCPHLSQDPTCLKYKSLSQTIQAFHDGRWTLATGHVPTYEESTHLLRPAYLEARACKLVSTGEFRVKPEPDTERQVPPPPVKPESFPAPTIVHNASSLALYVWNEETQNFINTPDWEFFHFGTTEDKAEDLLRRCDPEADYAIDYAAWVFEYGQSPSVSVGDSLDEQAYRAVMKAGAQFKLKAQEWKDRVAELERQAEKRKNAREAEER